MPLDFAAVSETRILAALEQIEQRQGVHEQVLGRLVDMLMIHNEKLDAILDAATRDPGPSAVAETLNAILVELQEQAGLLREMPASLAVTIRAELQRELEAEDTEWEEAEPGASDLSEDDRP